MKFIGITGGVGAGKSAILEYLSGKEGIRVMLADEIAHDLMEPGTECYRKLEQEFKTEDIFLPEGGFDRLKLAKVIFSAEEKRNRLNGIVHPAVKQYVMQEAEKERKNPQRKILVLEAALLIEEHYDAICDELWYIYTREEIREKRLMESRGYSKEKVRQIFDSQLKEEEFRKHCKVVIDNNNGLQETFTQIEQAIANLEKEQEVLKIYKTNREMRQMRGEEQPFVFGLDIGTRNVIGTVGYRDEDDKFIVVAQCIAEHETRSMLDGQIHDIGRVGKTIQKVKEKLEEQTEQPLTEVCIAAAGRVLKTVTTTITHEYPEETVVTGEDIHTLDLLGIEKAHGILKEKNDTKYKFYCVGYSVVKYYLNDDVISNLEGHKAEVIAEDIIVTFLPEDVVDGLYSAVGLAGLSVANMTLEPIAAINVAIPESFRMLNIALVDIGAGTSDISVTKDGSIIAYGMIPMAGDEITELIVQHYLVDFKTAEMIKLTSGVEDKITYKDIMLIEHTIPSSEVWKLTEPVVDRMTTDVANKIKELNGDQTVSAAFIVGGGGKIHGYTEMLAEKLDLPKERVALRGEEVLQEVTFEQNEIKKDPLLVTPIGICLNYYDQKNNFIMVRLNGERVKLYDNNKLTIVDAALQAGFPNEDLFPKRGKEINFVVNGVNRVIRGEAGESAVIYMNDKQVGINTPLEPNSDIVITKSTQGEDAVFTIDQLDEYQSTAVAFVVNGKRVLCPKFVEVNGSLESGNYEIKDGDHIDTRAFYTVSQLIEFMDVEIDTDREILVNNRVANMDTLVYENFTIDWTVLSFATAEQDAKKAVMPEENADTNEKESLTETVKEQGAEVETEKVAEQEQQTGPAETENAPEEEIEETEKTIVVVVNGTPVTLTSKKSYIFVDIFEHYDFDLTVSRGRAIITRLNGQDAQFASELNDGDEIELAWKEN